MKKTFLAALAALAITLSAQAQAPAHRPAHAPQTTEMHAPKGQHKKMDAQQVALRKAQLCRQELRLDDKQYDKVFKAYKTFFQQLEQKKPAEGQQPDKTLMKEAKDKLSKQMKKTLSDVQFAEWQQLEQRQWHKGQKAQTGRNQNAQPGRGKDVRHPAAQPGQAHGAKQGPHKMGARQEVCPDSVPGFHGNSRK